MVSDTPQMPKERWHRVVEIFGHVKDLPAAHRNSYLEVACKGDLELRRQVEDLLAEDAEAEDFLTPIWPPPTPGPSPASTFNPGKTAANRYDILQVLGEGGMGAVYKAWDRELDRTVVIKVIRPQLASSEIALKRFKRELLLTRQITHKNIVRIFDIGESDGTKFITMEYIDGGDLKKRMGEHGKFSATEAVAIVRQICHALDAAHSEGIVHRDLKPQNIMVQNNGRVVVTDFGIAHSGDTSAMTASGAVMGTPEYMAPEQAKGEKVDERTDLFSIGLIFYELLTRELPFKGDTLPATILKRITERAIPPAEIERTIPARVNRIIMRCLEAEPAKRYPSAVALLSDLDGIDPAPVTKWAHLLYRLSRLKRFWKPAVAVLAGVILGIVLYFFRRPPPPSNKLVQLLIADFSAESGVLDTPLEPVLTLALEGASFVDVADRQHAKTVAASIKGKQAALDEETARLVAVREGISTVVSGAVGRRAGKLQISAKAVDAASGRVLANDRVQSDKSGVLGAIAKLGSSIRSSLGDKTPESDRLAAAETFTAGSLEAMTYYAKAQELRSSGRWDDAIRFYSQATSVDPKMGRAYAGIAAASFNLGRTDDAERYYQLALANIDRMTDREKYRTQGGYFLTVRDYDRAIEQFKQLVEKFPADTAGYNNLALAYFYKRDMSNALLEAKRFVKLYPNVVSAHNNLALYDMYAGNFEASKAEAAKALQLTPSFIKGYVATALSELALDHPDGAAQTYDRLAALGSQGGSWAAIGLADLKMFEGRFVEAEPILQRAIAVDLENKQTAFAAKKLVMLGSVQMSLGRQAAGLASAQQAVSLTKDSSVLFGAARIFINGRHSPEASNIAGQLESRLEKEPQAYAKLIQGEMLLDSRKPSDAARKFEEARQLADTWFGRVDMGRAYLETRNFPQASAEFDAALSRRGEAAAVFLDDVPTYHYFAVVRYYAGRAEEGLNSPGAVEKYRAFLNIKSQSESDPLVEDAKRRVDRLTKR